MYLFIDSKVEKMACEKLFSRFRYVYSFYSPFFPDQNKLRTYYSMSLSDSTTQLPP